MTAEDVTIGALGDGERNRSFRLASAVGAGVGMLLSWLVLNVTGLSGFWPGVIATGVGASGGAFLGQLCGSRLFRGPCA